MHFRYRQIIRQRWRQNVDAENAGPLLLLPPPPGRLGTTRLQASVSCDWHSATKKETLCFDSDLILKQMRSVLNHTAGVARGFKF